MFDPSLSYIVNTETNYRKRRIKEAIFSSINNSINQHKVIDAAWNNILYKEQKFIKDMIKFKKNSQLTTTAWSNDGQDGNSGTDEENSPFSNQSITILSVPLLNFERRKRKFDNRQKRQITKKFELYIYIYLYVYVCQLNFVSVYVQFFWWRVTL